MNHTLLLTTLSDETHPGWLEFKRSLDHFSWPYHAIVHKWQGLGHRVHAIYEWLQTEDGQRVNHFFFADAYDSFALGPMEEAMQFVTKGHPFFKVIFSTEKCCYPFPELAVHFPDPGHQWRYINGGGWHCSRTAFMRMFEADPPPFDINDQFWYQDQFIKRNGKHLLRLEEKPQVYQTIAFEHPDDFSYRQGRLINLQTLTKPVIIHGNGCTEMSHIRKLLP